MIAHQFRGASISSQLARLDYRRNLKTDRDNPVLVQKAWRDRFSGASHWRKGQDGAETLLFWGCATEPSGYDAQQKLSSLIRLVDGRLGGTMTECDLVFITDTAVAVIEVKLNVEPEALRSSRPRRGP